MIEDADRAPDAIQPPAPNDDSTGEALYARYSSDNQSAASIEDQFRVCREYAAREKCNIVDTYHAWADVFATGGRCKPPGEADGKRHPRPEFSPPLPQVICGSGTRLTATRQSLVDRRSKVKYYLSLHVVVVGPCGLRE